MQVDFLLEEESAAAALRQLLPRLLPGYQCRLRVFEGCHDLLDQLPQLLRGYRRRMQQPGQHDLRLVVLVDADGIEARRRQLLESYAIAAHLSTWEPGVAAPFQVLNCLAVQELEAWFLGDSAAIQAAYGRVHPHHFKGMAADPDTIPDAWETLWRVLQRAGLFPAGKAKTEWATAIAPHLEPGRNASGSFRQFCAGVAALE